MIRYLWLVKISVIEILLNVFKPKFNISRIYTFMYITYFPSLYPFAVPKSDFLYKTASLR